MNSARERIYSGLKKHRGAQREVRLRSASLRKGGFSRSYVFQVLSGERKNLELLNLAADVLAEWDAKKATQINSLNNKVAQLSAANS